MRIIVGCNLKEDADILANKYPGIEPVFIDVNESTDTLEEFTSKAEVAVSLLPYSLHYLVAKACIRTKTHLVTASYLNDQVKSLHEE